MLESRSPAPSVRTLLETLLADQRRRWQQGQSPTVEGYLQQHPTLREQPDAVIDLISNEVLLREQRGETPRAEDYQAHFPHLAEELGRRFQTRPIQAPETRAASDAGRGEQRPGPTRSVSGSPVFVPETVASAAEPLPRAGPEALTIPGYLLEERLGHGGMGVVYRARQLDLDRPVALKTLLEAASAGSKLLERFQREARAVAHLQHPNIVQVFEVGTVPFPFFSMELVEGGSLDRRLRNGTLSPREAATLVEVLAQAMQHAHQAGIVHRDLKPANVLLCRDGTPKIADFGLAKRLDAEHSKTREGEAMGSPSYMAPEQAEGKNRAVGPLADVYALGAILYECLTGRPPFKAATIPETLLRVVRDEPVPPSRLAPDCPRELEAVCLKCLEKDPARRYASARELADELVRFREGRPILARPVGPLGRSWRWCRHRPAVAGLLAALFLAVAGGFALVSWKWYDADRMRHRAEAAEEAERRRADAEAAAHREAQRAARSLASGLASVTETFVELGRERTASGHWPQAARAFEKACRVVEERVGETDSVPLQAALVQGYTFLGVLRQKAALPLADEAYRRAAVLVARLSAVPPGELGDRAGYGQTCYVLAAALRGRNLAAAALTPGKQAVVHLAAALKSSPDNDRLRKAASAAYFELGEIQRRAGQPGAAAETALERQKLWPRDANQVYDVACELARCARAVGQGEGSLTAAQKAERRRHADRAMAVLKQAIDLGLTDVAGAARDEDFAVLRDREDFQKLVLGGKR